MENLDEIMKNAADKAMKIVIKEKIEKLNLTQNEAALFSSLLAIIRDNREEDDDTD